MNFLALLALFGRSVRDDTRSKALLWARIGIAVAVLFTVLRAQTLFSGGGAPGLAFFSSVVWMNFIFICVAGMSYFASSITEEKEEGTLGMLRMTDLSPLAILLGKSTSRFVGGLLLLLVQVPFVMLAITLGGVAFDQVLGCYAVLGAFLFFACNVGLLGSVLSWRTGVAAVVAVAIAILYQRWPMLLAHLPDFRRLVSDDLILAFDAASLLAEVLDNRGSPVPVGGGVLALLGGGAVAFAFAWGLFDRFCGEEAAPSAAEPASPAAGGAPQSFLRARPSRAWDDAICWRDYYYIHGGPRVALVKSLAYLAGAFLLASSMFDSGFGSRDYRITLYFAVVLGFSSALVIFESLFATSRIFRLERKDRTLSSLMILPSYYDAVLVSKRRAVVISLLPGLFFIVVSGLAVLVPVAREVPPAEFFIWFVQGAGYLVAQLFFNHYLVAWFSLRMKWGGLPLALGVSWLGNTFAAFIAALLFQAGAVMVLLIASVLASIAMRNAFRERLQAAASED